MKKTQMRTEQLNNTPKTELMTDTVDQSIAQRAKENMLSVAELDSICVIFRVLADPTRMKIVLGLLSGAMCVNQLMEICDGTQSAISHQLRILRDNKIVKCKRIGQSIEYSLADIHVREIVEMGVAHLRCNADKSEA